MAGRFAVSVWRMLHTVPGARLCRFANEERCATNHILIPNSNASFKALACLMSPLSLMLRINTQPASSNLKKIRQSWYCVRMLSNSSGSVVAPTSRIAVFFILSHLIVDNRHIVFLHTSIVFALETGLFFYGFAQNTLGSVVVSHFQLLLTKPTGMRRTSSSAGLGR